MNFRHLQCFFTLIALLAILSGPLRSETLYLDTFDNSNDDSSDVQLNGRTDFSGVSGLAASPDNYLESFGAQQELSGDELKLVKRSTQTAPGAGARFGAQTERFNWAAGTTGATILNEGGMKISLDFSLADVADNNDWITFAFGTVNNDGDSVSVYNASGVDYGLRFEGDRVVSFIAGATASIVPYSTSLANGEWATLEIELALDSFSAGSNVTAIVRVNGIEYINEVFSLDSTSDFRWEIGTASWNSSAPSNRVDNLTVETLSAAPSEGPLDDDFSSDTTSNYVESNVLFGTGTSGDPTFSVAGGTLNAAVSGFSGSSAVQSLYLHQMPALGIGETVILDYVSHSFSQANEQIGLAISLTADPPEASPNPPSTDSRRADLFTASYRPLNSGADFISESFVGTTNQGQQTGDATDLAGFFIRRVTEDEFVGGWIDTSGDFHPVSSYSNSAFTAAPAYVGLWTDIRSGGYAAAVDNLRVVAPQNLEDDFSVDTTSNYVESNVLFGTGTSGDPTFSVGGGTLNAAVSGFSGSSAIQSLYLHQIPALGIGETVILDYVSHSFSQANEQIGLAISLTADPPEASPNPPSTDSQRADLFTASYRPLNSGADFISESFVGTANQGQQTADASGLTGLFIRRLTEDSFVGGWIDGAGTFHEVSSYSNSAFTSAPAYVGLWTDIRSGGYAAAVDNLRVVAPENLKDDFSVDTTSNYVESNVLFGTGTSGDPTFSVAGGTLNAAVSGFSGSSAIQSLYLHQVPALGIGETVILDYVSHSFNQTNEQIGMAISLTADPPEATPNPPSTDSQRADLFTASYRPLNSVADFISERFVGTGDQGQQTGDASALTGLFIRRLTEDSFVGGWIDGAGTFHEVSSYSNSAFTQEAAYVGLWTDIRSSGYTASVDNLRVISDSDAEYTIEPANLTFDSEDSVGLSATVDGPPLPSTFELVAGEGDDDNALFQITGNQLEVSGDFMGEAFPRGQVFSVRIRATSTQGGGETTESVIQVVFDKDVAPSQPPVGPPGVAPPQSPSSLRVSDSVNPVGTDASPYFGWHVNDPDPNEIQSAYQILVASSAANLAADNGDLWDSGQVDSRSQNHVAYAGSPIQSDRRYHWKVRTWDKDGNAGPYSQPATFVVGLLANADWAGANWIRRSSTDADDYSYFRYQAPLPNKTIERATVYISTAHKYALYLNDKLVGKGPAYHYPQYQYYNAYDITSLVEGNAENQFAIFSHWFGGGQGRPANARGVIMKAIIHYDDGTSTVIGTDGNWRQSRANGWVAG